ncbi:MAG: TonB-dependent receptor [Phenylobacterium zucineum]|nr:MAG: TonB-dependent receptor [Phenylobacterium zucineum]
MLRYLLGTASLAAMLATPGLALAQASQDTALDEVVVTAERRTANIQDVPVAVTAITGKVLQESGVRDPRGIQQFVPNLQFKNATASSTASIFIRGVGVDDFNSNTTGAVGVYVDDVFLAANAGKLFNTFDGAGVEVLRGPQGTLYGRNTTGGAIKFTSKKPTDDVSGDLEVSYGNFNGLRVEAGIGGPLVDDRLKARISGFRETRDGYTTNLVTGNKVNDIEVWGARGMLEFTPTDTFTALLSVHGGKNSGDARQFVFRGQLAGGCDLSGYCGSGPDIDKQAYNLEGKEILESFGASLKMEQEFGWGTLTSVSAYEKLNRETVEDTDASPADIIDAFYQDKPRQFSQEVRLQSNAGQKVTWIVGGYYLHDKLKTGSYYNILGLFRDPTAPFNGADPDNSIGQVNFPYTQTSKSLAAFGQADYHISEDLTATVGLRYSRDRIRLDYRRFYLEPQGIIPGTLLSLDRAKSFSDVSYRAALNYKPNADTLLYASISTGYNAGGFPGGSADDLAQLQPYRSEKLHAYEVGYKSEFFGRRLRIATSAFYYDYKNIQVFILDDSGVLPVQRKGNAKGAEIYGVELESFARPIRPLELSFAASYTHSKYRTFTIGADDYTGNTLTNTPKFTFSASIQYTHDMDEMGALVARLEGYAQSKVFFQPNHDPLYAQDAYQQLNGRLTYRPDAGAWDVGLWVKNIANQRFTTGIYPIITSDEVNYNEPRTYGVRFGYHF